MKRRFSVLLVILSALLLSACGLQVTQAQQESNSEELNMDNYNLYLKNIVLYAEANKTLKSGDPAYDHGYYLDSIHCTGSIEGISNFIYNDASVTFEIKLSALIDHFKPIMNKEYEKDALLPAQWMNLTQELRGTVQLRKDGSATISFNCDLLPVEEVVDGYLYPDIIEILGYEIVDVSGTVEKA